MTKHFTEEGGSCVLGEFISLKELAQRERATTKPFIVSTKQKEYFIKGMGLEEFKQYVRNYGFDSILIIDNFGEPAKGEIIL
ncbi:hypothetical protein [Robertmurraya sp.]|uniref:hypothetical protein n=1 Tax=Robertmurraya sp. TaxID=2837525 RepID=UPI003703F098